MNEPAPTTVTVTIARPPTPPPPIISAGTPPKSTDNDRKPKEVKQANPHFEAVRAKLANATKMSGNIFVILKIIG